MLASFCKLHVSTLEKYYKHVLTSYDAWKEEHAEKDFLLYPENMGRWLSIDEVVLQKGELYTLLTNKQRHGKKGALIALVKGTKAAVISEVLHRLPVSSRFQVQEITADLSPVMDWVLRSCFPNSTRTADRFHVQSIVHDAVQELRLSYKREAREEENTLLLSLSEADKKERRRVPTLANGDTRVQLLTRAKYLLYVPEGVWSDSQRRRAALLFAAYPLLQTAYTAAQDFRSWYEKKYGREQAKNKLEEWCEGVTATKLLPLLQAVRTVRAHEGTILNYFIHYHSNAAAESFNAKLKGFRAVLRGVKSLPFFLLRVERLFA